MTAHELGNRPASEQTHRQWLAGMAMQGVLANPHTAGESYDAIARRSWNQADAILAREAQEAGDER